MSAVKRLLAAIYIERDFFNGNEVRAQEAAATDAGDFADYEAAVEALERIVRETRFSDAGNATFPPSGQSIKEGRAALARLRGER